MTRGPGCWRGRGAGALPKRPPTGTPHTLHPAPPEVHQTAPTPRRFETPRGLGPGPVSGRSGIAPFATQKVRGRGGGKSVFLGVASSGGGRAGGTDGEGSDDRHDTLPRSMRVARDRHFTPALGGPVLGITAISACSHRRAPTRRKPRRQQPDLGCRVERFIPSRLGGIQTARRLATPFVSIG